ncbi:MAG: PH domain-containing protein [Actinomycetota bacterium]
MAYPRKLLTDGETIEIEMHPHGKALILPILVLLLVIPLASYLITIVPPGSAQLWWRIAVAVVAVGVLIPGTLMPFLHWVTTHYVVTDRRIITRKGIVARSGRDMPLARINDVSFSHTVIERILGCGTLVIESAGERGQLILNDVPRVEFVHRRLYDLLNTFIEPDEESSLGETAAPS